MGGTIGPMKTGAPITRRQLRRDDILAEIAASEAQYPGLHADNVETFFNDTDGVVPEDRVKDYFRIAQLYHLVAAGAAT